MNILILIVGILFFTTVSHGHLYLSQVTNRMVDASWIEKHHSDCCGKDDCKPVPGTDVARMSYGWTVEGLEGSVLNKDVRKSEDNQWWACGTSDEDYDEGVSLECLFKPKMPAYM